MPLNSTAVLFSRDFLYEMHNYKWIIVYKKTRDEYTETTNVANSVNIDRMGQKLFQECENSTHTHTPKNLLGNALGNFPSVAKSHL